MVATPPHHAWAWFARQRLLWRSTREALASMDEPLASRYGLVDDRQDVLDRLKADYPVDESVRRVVHRRIDAAIFLGHAHRGLEGLGIRNAPRGLRWWWAAVTGREVPAPRPESSPDARRQLSFDLQDPRVRLDDVHTGWGDRHR